MHKNALNILNHRIILYCLEVTCLPVSTLLGQKLSSFSWPSGNGWERTLVFQLVVMARNIQPCGTKAMFAVTLVDHNTNAWHQTHAIWHLLLYHHMALRTLSYAIPR